MSKNNYPIQRKPTATVKCPHCDHTGSARGLFTHVRLRHPGITEKPKTSTKITAHPYDIKGMGHIKEKVHRIEKQRLKEGQYDWLINIATKLLEKVMEEHGILQSKGYKPATLGSIETRKVKRKHYGE